MDILAVVLIVAGAALVVGRRLIRSARGSEGEGGGCGSCGEASCGACPSASELVPLGRRTAGGEPPGARSA